MKKIYFCVLVLVFFTVFLSSPNSYGQISKSISSISNTTSQQNSDVTFDLDLFQANTVSRITFFYKPFGESSYKSRDVIVTGIKANVTIPKEEVVPPSIEYYFMIELKDGNIETYPIDFDRTKLPLTLKVEPLQQKETAVILLSPEPGFKAPSSDLLISVSLFGSPLSINRDMTKLFIDDRDVSENALYAGDLINYYPDNFEPKLQQGSHTLKVVLYDTTGKEASTFTSVFKTVSVEQFEEEKSKFTYRMDVNAELRNEKLGDNSTFYNNLGVNFAGEYNDWKINSNIYLTSEEKSYMQPYNRYFLSIQNNNLALSVGDIFPRFTSLILDGKRVRGIYGDIKTGGFEIKTVYGEITRATDGRILQMYNSGDAPLTPNIIDIDSAKYGKSKAEAVLGAYKRNLFAIRTMVGSESGFLWGLNYLHSKDDIESIEFGANPKENLVLGTDFSWAFDNKNIILTGQAAFSLSNRDITNGELSDALIDTVFKKDGGLGGGVGPQKIKDLKNVFGSLITVNQYVVPFNPLELATLAAETALMFNYFDNSLKLSYLYRGNDFQSFGQQFSRTDVSGFNITDNARLISDKVFLSLSFERLQDNLQKTKFATTTYQSIGTSVSIFPRADFPNIVLGYNRYDNNNDIDTTKSSSDEPGSSKALYKIDDITNRFFIQLGYGFTAGVKHQASFSLSLSDRTDNGPSAYDLTNTSAYLSLNSYWDEDLMSFFNLSINNSKIKNVEISYTGFSIGARQSLLEKKLDVTANISPTFGDLKRVAYEVSSRYNALKDLFLTLQFRYLSYSEVPNDLIVSLSARYGIN